MAVTLAAELARSVRVTIVTCEPRLSSAELHALPELPWSDHVPFGCAHVHLPSVGGGATRLVRLAVRLAVLARRERFDAVVSFLTWTNVLVALSRVLGGRYEHVASEHAMAASLRSDGRHLASLARTLPLLYRLPDHLVVVSDAARRSLVEAGVVPRPERAVTIPNPVDATSVRELAEQRLAVELPPGRPLIACVARLHRQKDHLTLLRALTLMPPSSTLVLAGDGEERDAIEAAAAGLGVRDRVVLLGAVANPYPLMRAADVVVLPSLEEGFGLVAVEAATLGTPFVGSDVGGLGELCGSLGLRTFPVGDHRALARAISETVVPRGERDVPDMTAFTPAHVARAYLDLILSSGRAAS